MRYTIDQIKTALLLLKTTGSPNKVIELLGYPSNPMLYYWRDKYPEYYDTPIQKYLKQAPLELKRNTIERCTIGGESVKSVAEDIGYSPSLIYKGGVQTKTWTLTGVLLHLFRRGKRIYRSEPGMQRNHFSQMTREMC
jgi:hypothetical protein